MFSAGSYAKIWKVKDVKDKYTVCEVSTSKKNKDGKYETDFSDGRVRFVGKAHSQKPQADQKIKILNCGVSNYHDKQKNTTYTTYVIFDYELDNPVSTMTNSYEEDLPFIV